MPQGSAKAYQDGFGPMGAFTTRELCRAQTFHVDPDRDAGTRLQAGKGFGGAKEYDKAREQFLMSNRPHAASSTAARRNGGQGGASASDVFSASPGTRGCCRKRLRRRTFAFTRIPHAPFASTASRDEHAIVSAGPFSAVRCIWESRRDQRGAGSPARRRRCGNGANTSPVSVLHSDQ